MSEPHKTPQEKSEEEDIIVVCVCGYPGCEGDH